MKTLLLLISAFFLLGCNLHVEQTKEWPAKPKEFSAKEKRLKFLEKQLQEVGGSNSENINEILLMDPFNENAIREIVSECYRLQDYDSCSRFLDNLIKKYPDSPAAFVIKATYFLINTNLKDPKKIEELWQKFSIKGLLKAIEVDSNFYDANLALAIAYYKLFQKKPTTEYAGNAIKWFVKAANIDTVQRAFFKYPIIQLSTYSNDTAIANAYSKFTYKTKTNNKGVPDGNKHDWYFPFENFLTLEQNWKTDSSLDLMHELKNAYFVLDWFSNDLLFFQEPMISEGYKCDVYRFLYLRSFNVPVVMRMERNNGEISIRWKKCRYNQQLDQYEWGVDSTKKLSNREWAKFEKMLDKVDYWNMPTENDDGAMDGAEWILEAFVNGKYKIAATNMEHSEYGKCLRYLMDLTDLNLPEREIY